MKIPLLEKQEGSLMSSFWLPVLTVGLGFLAKYPFDGAEDVINARNNLISGVGTDFWGSWSSWFFSVIEVQHWEFVYAGLFSLFILYGLTKLLVLIRIQEKRNTIQILMLLLAFESVLFCLSFSRDGALLSFLWLSLGFGISSLRSRTFYKQLLAFFSILTLIMAFSFRPWLGVCAPLFLLGFKTYFLRTKIVTKVPSLLMTVVVLGTSPLLLDQSFHKILNLKKSYPQQQVMIMDLSGLACLSASRDVSDISLNALRILSNQTNITKEILCGQFYPQNWGSVVFYGHRPDQAPALRMIPVESEIQYREFKEAWKKITANNVQAYLQLKFILGSQFLFAGDSISFQLNSFRDFLNLPLAIGKFLRLFSAFPICLLLIFWIIRKSRRQESRYSAAIVLLSYFLFLVLSVIAFVGDNQRYILSGSIVVYLFILIQYSQETAKNEL